MATEKHPDPIIVTRAIVKRAWSDFEPKLVSGLMSGTVASGIISILDAYGIHVPTPITLSLPLLCVGIAGWWTGSVGTVTTVRTGDGLVVEKHSGQVEISTGLIPVQAPAIPVVPRGTGGYPPSMGPAPVARATPDAVPVPVARATPDAAPAPAPAADPEPSTNDTPGFTEVIQPETTRGGAILSQLPSASGTRAAYYEDDNH